MRRKMIVVILAGFLAAPTALFAQSAIDQLSADLEYMFQELGKELVPNLQTVSVLNHELGSAYLGEFPRMYFSLSAGGTLDQRGVLKFTKPEFSDRYQNYSLFNNLFEEISLNDEETRDITDNYLPLPSLRAGFGIGLAHDMELSFQVGMMRQATTDSAISSASDDEDLQDIRASIVTLGTRLRRVIVKPERGVPAISVGVGYVYSGIDFGFPVGTTDPLDLGGGQSLAIDGEIVFKSITHSFGFDVRASQRVIRVLYPFVGMSAYYQVTDFEMGVKDFGGEIIAGDDPVRGTGNTVPVATQPFSEQQFRNFNVVLNTGFDIKLAIFNIFLHGNYALSTRAP
jgi:hypothetical protein